GSCGGVDRLRFRAIMALGVVAVVALAGVGWLVWSRAPGTPGSATLGAGDFTVQNATYLLGPTFTHGAPQAFGFNATDALVTGVVGNPGPLTVPYALLGAFGLGAAGSAAVNRSSEVATLFHGGDTLGVAWNGSSWLLTGEAAWGTDAGGAAAALTGGRWTNLTPLLGPYFGSRNGGTWFDAWNGSSWLLGGSDQDGAALVALRGNSVTNLTALLPNNGPALWIQFLAWNGSAWLIGGQGIFGALRGTQYTNLLLGSPALGSGMFAAGWSGQRWLVGGGSPGWLEYLDGTTLTPAPTLPSSVSKWVSTIVWDGRGWFIGGAGSTPTSFRTAQLLYLDPSSDRLVNLSAQLPSAFEGGQIQFAGPSPLTGLPAVLLLGQGGVGATTPYGSASHGAAALIFRI
ncbi:MAG TPA: hypothetical protein VGU43_07000, partial [Thermoplasmata archaeon]|nr:hypothetical protein [Thermoplasmata archaeon]